MTPTEVEAAPVEPQPEKRGFGRVLLGVIVSPRATFAYLRDNGGRSWLWLLLIVALLTLAARAVAAPIEKAQADAAFAAIQAQLNGQGQNTQGKGTFFISSDGNTLTNAGGATAGPLFTYGLPVAGVVWDWLLRGGIVLGLAWLLGGRPAPGAMFRMSSWTLLPNVARLLVALTVMIVAHREPISGLQGLGAPATNVTINSSSNGGDSNSSNNGSSSGGPVLRTVQIGQGGGPGGPSFLTLLKSQFLGALDLYTFWSLVLLLIGAAVTARIGWLKATLSTAVYWAISLALGTLPALLSFLLLSVARPGNIVGP